MPCEHSILGLENFGSNPSKSKRPIYKLNYRTRRKKIPPKPPTDGQLWFDFKGPRETTGTENLHHSETPTDGQLWFDFEGPRETTGTKGIHHKFPLSGSKISKFIKSLKKWLKENFSITSIVKIFLDLLRFLTGYLSS